MALSPLQNKLRTSSGQLANVSSEELAAQTGRAAPTSPMENKVIGGTPQQAAMAGTPNQKTSALRQAIQGSASLQTRQRLQQPTTQISDAQQAQKDKLSELQALSGMEGRVGDLLNKQFSEASTLEGLQFNLDKAPEDDRGLLQRIQEGDTKAIAEYANKKGISAQQAADEIRANYAIDSGISEQVSATTASLINNTEVDFTELGYESSDQVAELLGIDPEEFMNMNLGDTIDFINKKIEEEYSSADSLRAILDDPSVGPAEKADARQQLRDMGAVGIKAAESDAEQLADDVAQSKTIEFNGEETTIDKILEDEYLEGVIANALENEEFMDELKENEPGLAKFIQENKDILTGISEQIDENTQMVIETTEANKALSGGLDESIMKSIYGDDWGQVSDTKLEVGENGLLSYVNDASISTETKQNVTKNINELSKKYPGLVDKFANMSAADISALGLDGSNPAKLEQINSYYAGLEKYKNLSAQYPDGNIPIQLIMNEFLFPGSDKSPQENFGLLKDAITAANSGMLGDIKLPEGIIGPDGQVSESKLKEYVNNMFSSEKGLSNLAAEDVKVGNSFSTLISDTINKASNNPVYTSLQSYMGDGTVDSREAAQLGKDLDLDSIQQILDSTSGHVLPPDAYKALKTEATKKINSEISAVITAQGTGYNIGMAQSAGRMFSPNATSEEFAATEEKINGTLDALKTELSNAKPGSLKYKVLQEEMKKINDSKQTLYNKRGTKISKDLKIKTVGLNMSVDNLVALSKNPESFKFSGNIKPQNVLSVAVKQISEELAKIPPHLAGPLRKQLREIRNNM